jgi:hypothetical protein
MIRAEAKSQKTAYQYSVAINRLSAHYTQATGQQTDIYRIDDQLLLDAIAHDYGRDGRFQEIGNLSNKTNRNAIASYVRFFEQEGHAIPADEEGVDVNAGNGGNAPAALIVEDINNFTYERDLKYSLIRNINELFPDYRIYGNNNEGVEFPIGGRRIDLLLENENDNSLLVIELKAGVANEEVFEQISWYLGSLMQQFPERTINGIIIAGEISNDLRIACAITNRIRLMTYTMNITLEE